MDYDGAAMMAFIEKEMKVITVQELIKKLQCFDEHHAVSIEVDAECGHLKVKCEIDDVQFKHGDCVLTGFTD